MLEILLIIVCVLALLGLLLVLWPVRVRMHVAPETARAEVSYVIWRIVLDMSAKVQTVYLFGVPVSKSPLKPPTVKKVRSPKAEEPPPRAKTKGPDGTAKARILWEHRPLLRRTLLVVSRLVGRLLRAWKLERGRLWLVAGTSDPAQTGMLAGGVYAALPTIQMALPRWQIGFTPEFRRARIAAEIDITLRLIPLEPLYHFARALGTLPWRGLWKLKAALSQP